MPDDGGAQPQLEAFYLPMGEGRRYCMLHEPGRRGLDAGSVLYVHPFAEEMNKSRRMAALQSRALAMAGWTVLQVDLAGCGDSEGEFGQASWERWIDDVGQAAAWLRDRSGRAPWLWGLRVGCLVAAAAAKQLDSVPGMLFWQPVVSGKQFLQQFLRLKVAAQILGPVDAARTDTRELRQHLLQGRSVEIAGYELSPALASGLEGADLAPLPDDAPVVWIEIAGAEAGELSPAARTRAEQWRGAGHAVEARCVTGPPFWQTQEIAECPPLIEATLMALASARHSAEDTRPTTAGARS